MKILFFFHLFIPLISAFFFNKNEYVEMKKYFIRKNIDIVDDKLYYYLNIRLKLCEEIGLLKTQNEIYNLKRENEIISRLQKKKLIKDNIFIKDLWQIIFNKSKNIQIEKQ